MRPGEVSCGNDAGSAGFRTSVNSLDYNYADFADLRGCHYPPGQFEKKSRNPERFLERQLPPRGNRVSSAEIDVIRVIAVPGSTSLMAYYLAAR